MIIGGDFNCVLNPAGTTGTFQTSRSLSKIVTRLALIDTWTQDPLRPTYTHHQQHRSYTNRPPLCIPRLGAEKIRKRNHTCGHYRSPRRSAPRNNTRPDNTEGALKMGNGPDRDAR